MLQTTIGTIDNERQHQSSFDTQATCITNNLIKNEHSMIAAANDVMIQFVNIVSVALAINHSTVGWERAPRRPPMKTAIHA